MLKISTYSKTFEIPFNKDFECNFGLYYKPDGDNIFRFFRGEAGTPWNSSMNDDTIFAYTLGYGMMYREPSLSNELNEIFLDIIDMMDYELEELKRKSNTKFKDIGVLNVVLGEKLIKLIREKKLNKLMK